MLVTTEHLAELFEKLGRPETAYLLITAAAAAGDASPLYGAHGARLDTVRQAAELGRVSRVRGRRSARSASAARF